MKVFLWLFGLIFALSSSFCFAAERENEANKLVLKQLQFLSLIEGENKFVANYQSFISGGGYATAAEQQRAEQDAIDFWHKKNVPVRDPEPENLDDPFMRAMALEPKVNGYLQVSNRVQHLLWLEQHYEWGTLAIDGLLKSKDRHPSIAEIARRVALLGDGPLPEKPSAYFDQELIAGIKKFQTRHGLQSDGVIGPETLKWLNMKPAKRASLLVNNFVSQSQFYSLQNYPFLVVNIPEFEMRLIDEQGVALTSRVIVGKPQRQTPLLSGQISNVVINPSWRVPKKILVNDVLPHVRKDGEYIKNKNFEVFDHDGVKVTKTAEQWKNIAGGRFPYILVQRPGPTNTLGRYKFYFPNDESIYLHDTVDPDLFNHSSRALSSGCIRVENVQGLANWIASNLVKDKQTWVDMHRRRDKTQWFALNSKLAVHLVYWTAWIDETGLAQYRKDIYQLQDKSDEKLAANLIQ